MDLTAKAAIFEKLKTRKVPFIIGIAGDSGSGKTTFCKGIQKFFGKEIVTTFTLDGYHKENREQRKSSGRLPLDPEANRLDLFREHLMMLKEGDGINLPLYDHDKGDFSPSVEIKPTPIIIIEGLHTLYPEFLPFIDFGMYVDPSRDVKWSWKYERDIHKRHHEAGPLFEEMLKRETAYKRYIDFQKTNAKVVIKIINSKIDDFARYECINKPPHKIYKTEVIMQETKIPSPNIDLPIEMTSLVDTSKPPFLIAAVPSTYWGKKVIVMHIDGLLPKKSVFNLEKYLHGLNFSNTEDQAEGEGGFDFEENDQITPTQFVQLFIAWRFSALMEYHLLRD